MKKVEVNKDLCIACGMCVQMNNDVFGYGDDGRSEVKTEIVDDGNKTVIEAAENCPTGAISVTDMEEHCCGGDCHCGCHEGNECSCEK